jgi:hypothetical protein
MRLYYKLFYSPVEYEMIKKILEQAKEYKSASVVSLTCTVGNSIEHTQGDSFISNQTGFVST